MSIESEGIKTSAAPAVGPASRSSQGGPGADRQAEVVEFERFLGHAQKIGSDPPLSLRVWLDLAETWRITQALRACGGNRSAAARALGIGRRTLYAKMEKLGITPTWRLGDSPLESSLGRQHPESED